VSVRLIAIVFMHVMYIFYIVITFILMTALTYVCLYILFITIKLRCNTKKFTIIFACMHRYVYTCM